MSDGYRLVFDATRDWSYYGFLIPFSALLLFFSIFAWWEGRRPNPRPNRWIGVGFPAVMILVLLAGMVPPRAKLRRALAERRYEVVEGVVTDYRPAPKGWNGYLETFTVAGHHYSIASYLETSPGYGKTQPTGSPIREGLRVRIVDVGGVIAQLEVADAPR